MITDLKLKHIKGSIKNFKIKVTDRNSFIIINMLNKSEEYPECKSLAEARDLVLKRCSIILSVGDEIPAEFLISLK